MEPEELERQDRNKRINQLNRWHNRLFKRIGWGWDVPTLRICEPSVFNSYKRLCDIARPLRKSSF